MLLARDLFLHRRFGWSQPLLLVLSHRSGSLKELILFFGRRRIFEFGSVLWKYIITVLSVWIAQSSSSVGGICRYVPYSEEFVIFKTTNYTNYPGLVLVSVLDSIAGGLVQRLDWMVLLLMLSLLPMLSLLMLLLLLFPLKGHRYGYRLFTDIT